MLLERNSFSKTKRCNSFIKVSVDVFCLSTYLKKLIDPLSLSQRIFEGENGKQCINLSFESIGTLNCFQKIRLNFFHHCHSQQTLSNGSLSKVFLKSISIYGQLTGKKNKNCTISFNFLRISHLVLLHNSRHFILPGLKRHNSNCESSFVVKTLQLL